MNILIDYDSAKTLDELTEIDEGWYKEHMEEISLLTYAQSIDKYPVETLKIAVRRHLGLALVKR